MAKSPVRAARDTWSRADVGHNLYVVQNMPKRVVPVPVSVERKALGENRFIEATMKVIRALLLGVFYPFYFVLHVVPNWIIEQCTYPAQVLYGWIMRVIRFIDRRFIDPVRRLCRKIQLVVIEPTSRWLILKFLIVESFIHQKISRILSLIHRLVSAVNKKISSQVTLRVNQIIGFVFAPRFWNPIGNALHKALSSMHEAALSRMERSKAISKSTTQGAKRYASQAWQIERAFRGWVDAGFDTVQAFSREFSLRLQEVFVEIRQRFIG